MQNILGDCISAARNMRSSSLRHLAAVHVPRLERLQLGLVFLEVLGFVTTLQNTHLLALRVISTALYMLCVLCYHWLAHTLTATPQAHTLTTTYSPLVVEAQFTHTHAAPRPAHSTHTHNHTALTPSHNTHSIHSTHTHSLPPFSLWASPAHKAMTLSLASSLSLYVYNVLTVALCLWLRDPWALFEVLSLCAQAVALSVLLTVRERLRDGDIPMPLATHTHAHTHTHTSPEPSLRRSADHTAAEEAKEVSESADNRRCFDAESSV